MRKKLLPVFAGLLAALSFTACGNKDELVAFRNDVDTFCLSISDIGTKIDSIDAESDNAVNEIIVYLDELNTEFSKFAELDFPEQFDYLEPIADEAGEYMSTAVTSFKDAYTNESYDEEMFRAQYDYARENEARAYKRIQIIITFLHGEQPENVDLLTDETTSLQQ